jgi:hypothetical protein
MKQEYSERTTDHEQATGKLYHLRLRVDCTLFVIYKAGRENITYIVSINYCSRSEDTDEITCFAVEVDNPDSFTAIGRKWIVQNIDKWDENNRALVI